mmetsp:Transcript_58621/g.154990  ORF Transcript_58621/g.154990 Transcript_58621/m.154990 type:complete len:176 (-) Transcript_58621:2590-3117(-)
MDALGEYSSDESSEAESSKGNEETQRTEPLEKSKLPNASKAGEENSKKESEGGKLPEPKKRRLLPSAAALLSGNLPKPSFLSAAASKEPVFDLPMETKSKEESGSDEEVVIPQPYEPADISVSAVPVPQTTDANAGKSGKKADVKDKLKAARLKGQSAHTRWKSEGEMLLRQQYD